MRGIRAIPFAAWVAVYVAALAIVSHFVLSEPWLSCFGAAAIVYALLMMYWIWERRRSRPRAPDSGSDSVSDSGSESGSGVSNGGKHRARDFGTADQQVR